MQFILFLNIAFKKMHGKKLHQPIVSFIAVLLLNLLVNLILLKKDYNPISVLLWLMGFILVIIPFSRQIKDLSQSFNLSAIRLSALFFLFLPMFLRIINIDIERVHADEFITAYFSTQYDFEKTNFFGPIPSGKEWIVQFPSVYFVLQRIFFMFFGESPLTVKLSVMPYVFVVSLMLFLLVRKMFNVQMAVISLVLYSFFAPALYLETFGLHFISSTAVFLMFFYFVILSVERKNQPLFALLAGISAGFCYLFYVSSYLALPFLFLFYTVSFLKDKAKKLVLKNLSLSLFAFLMVVAPFIGVAFHSKNPYILTRYNQVNIIHGEWSVAKDSISSIPEAALVIKKSLVDSLFSFFRDDIGGHGGYEFGRLAFFDEFSLFLFVLGLAYSLTLLPKKPELFFVLLVIAVSFISGVVFTIQPPAFHRFSLAYPFVVIILSLPFYFFSRLKKGRPLVIFSVLITLLIFVVVNQRYFLKSVNRDIENNREDLKDIKIIKYINQHYPERKVYLAAFPAHGLGRVFYFFNPNKKIEVDYHDVLLSKINPGEKYLYIILFPDQFNEKFKKADENGRIIDDIVDKYSLFVN